MPRRPLVLMAYSDFLISLHLNETGEAGYEEEEKVTRIILSTGKHPDPMIFPQKTRLYCPHWPSVAVRSKVDSQISSLDSLRHTL
jgi:hypothetical protein